MWFLFTHLDEYPQLLALQQLGVLLVSIYIKRNDLRWLRNSIPHYMTKVYLSRLQVNMSTHTRRFFLSLVSTNFYLHHTTGSKWPPICRKI